MDLLYRAPCSVLVTNPGGLRLSWTRPFCERDKGKRVQNNSNFTFLPNHNNSNEEGRFTPKQADNFLIMLVRFFFSACHLQILLAS